MGGGEGVDDEKRTARPRGTDSAKVIQVIRTEALEGRGTGTDPVRTVIRYWDFNGELLAVNDPEVPFPEPPL